MNNHVSEPFRGILNQFAHLSAENPEHRNAQMTPEESAEYAAYLDEQRAREESEVPLEDACPRCACNPCKCNWTPEDEAERPYDGGGWPGDGSGTDDLADLMAHGDEGCCDGPGD